MNPTLANERVTLIVFKNRIEYKHGVFEEASQNEESLYPKLPPHFDGDSMYAYFN